MCTSNLFSLTDSVQFTSDGFQAFCCDSSHNIRAKRARSGLKRIGVREEVIALMLTSEEKGAGAQGCLFSRLPQEKHSLGLRGWKGSWSSPRHGVCVNQSSLLASHRTNSIIPERNVLIGQAVALGLTREGGEAAL